ncbi:subtilisin-like protein [Candidatus Magnetobacterium bavaricum]|uniref:Subtilisin-like protein n=1 Tax=Candidatus Magnetobacterium bavaricum TaxID=29290 RepID=A0A0F3GM62_9BACT|nr:subtilisin-like protein [Candidatus Magnetobacterium bavaricum]
MTGGKELVSPLRLIRLESLMTRTQGTPDVTVGIIDGPVEVNHPDFRGVNIRSLSGSNSGVCKVSDSAACMHGTFVAGIICSQRGSQAPAICPGCAIVLRPIFREESLSSNGVVSSTPSELVRAIIEVVDAGARVINLSVGLIGVALNVHHTLQEALDYAGRAGAIVVVAAGNQGTMTASPLINHPCVIPVAACDDNGRISGGSNISPSIGRYGLMAPGVGITSASATDGYATLSGTSFAAAFVTGAIALLMSEFPGVGAAEIRRALLTSSPRRRMITPPCLDVEAAWNILKATHNKSINNRRYSVMSAEIQSEGLTQDVRVSQEGILTGAGDTEGLSAVAAIPAQQSSPTASVSCAPQGCDSAGQQWSFIFALGSVDVRFPNMGVEKEFHQIAAAQDVGGVTSKEVRYNVLKANRHLAKEVCWVLQIEGIDTYILLPSDPFYLDMLVDCIHPLDSRAEMDIDVVIGLKGPIAPPEMCSGLSLPIVAVNNIYQCDIQKFSDRATKDTIKKIMAMADNAGEMDAHRAVNYLAVRCDNMYALVSKKCGSDKDGGYLLEGIDVKPSRLGAARKILNVIFAFYHKSDGYREKYYIRVDVNDKYPFTVGELSEYYENRGA